MTRILCTLLLASTAAFAQMDHDAMMRGDHVMGFSHDKTTHHFELNQDGGVIEVRANDLSDTQTRDQIRGHFHHIVQVFAAGNFQVPMLVHAQNVPGTAVMSQLKDQLHWQLEDTRRGAKITVTADNKAGSDAVHEFLRFQIADHKTGDCTAVR
ncbi:MAG TPA: hypothetical protein VK493_15090 [Bryobacteraceae bacterium]|nr:hypothetical protein [Bryobacteraceae bacterium]